MMKSSIYKTLKNLRLTSKETRVLYSTRTRDVENLNVWKDEVSGVIYIDDFYAGDDTYVSGAYREQKTTDLNTGGPCFERNMDVSRRVKSYLKFVSDKRIADFGCGNGDFLRSVQPYCSSVFGVELQKSYVDSLNSNGISCVRSLNEINDDSLDVVVSFHVFEHLPKPLETLSEIIKKVVSGGHILIEVPHAKDFLLSTLGCEEFKQFTLWSQHLVLHTRESLRKTLESVGLQDIQIEGVQRYPLSNHLKWLTDGKPGGHKSALAMLDSDMLYMAYQGELARIDATDTLVAIARVP